MKIAVYGICLNEAKFVKRFTDSARDADLIQIADTGSTDNTVALFESLGVTMKSIRINPWRFDDARNAALALLPSDIDVCISLDLDTVLSPGWRKALEAVWKDGVNRAYYNEIWGRTPDGQPRQFLNNRVHARFGFRWVSPCHEYVMADRIQEKSIVIPGFTIEQFADPNKSRGQYLPLLELAAKEQPQNPRHAHYLGREYMFHGRVDEAIAEFERYIAMPTNFPTERNGTLRMLAECLETAGRGDEALARYRQATEEAPQLRGAWVDYAYALYVREQWQPCYDAALKAIALERRIAEYGEETLKGVLPEDLAAICGWRLGHFQDALRFGREAMRLSPGVERISANVAKMEAVLSGQAVVDSSGQTIAAVKPAKG